MFNYYVVDPNVDPTTGPNQEFTIGLGNITFIACLHNRRYNQVYNSNYTTLPGIRTASAYS